MIGESEKMKITLKDGSVRNYESPISVIEIAKELSEGLARVGLMLDRMSLSIKNKWLDEEKKAYIYFSLEDIMELLNCGRNKAVKSLQELDDENGIGLIEKRRQGMGKSNMIYVKSFVIEESLEAENDKFTNEIPAENIGDLEV